MSGVGFGMVVAAAALGLPVVIAHFTEETEASNASWQRLQVRLFRPLAIGMAAVGFVLMAINALR